MRYYTNILLGKNFVRSSVVYSVSVIMTTLDHAVEEECRRILLEEGREGGGRRRRRDKFHVFMSAVKMARLVNLISHYVVDIS